MKQSFFKLIPTICRVNDENLYAFNERMNTLSKLVKGIDRIFAYCERETDSKTKIETIIYFLTLYKEVANRERDKEGIELEILE